MGVGFTAEVDPEAAQSYAASFLAPGSALPTEDLVADMLATDGAARTGILASIEAGTFADEIRVVAELTRPVAVLHGEGEQLISLDYVEGLTMPTLWRGAVQILPGWGTHRTWRRRRPSRRCSPGSSPTWADAPVPLSGDGTAPGRTRSRPRCNRIGSVRAWW